MLLRQIIHIDETKCNGCGLCAEACHEGAIGMLNGKAKLLREDYCDGMGDCLPNCPVGAITFEVREAPAYNEKAVAAHKQALAEIPEKTTVKHHAAGPINWPVQLKLTPVKSPAFDGAKLLIAADCTAYAAGDFRSRMAGKAVLIACTKLDDTDYSEKLSAIFKANAIRSIEIVRTSVPCCGGLKAVVEKALALSGQTIPCTVEIIPVPGQKTGSSSGACRI